MTSIYDFEARTIDGRVERLGRYREQVLLIVNVASRCGFTPQYQGLEQLYRRHKDRGFTVLGFPCNQFGGQEPASESEIQQFCSRTYDVTFPMFAKIDVNGAGADPLYRYLTAERRGWLWRRSISWNFTKFLVDRSGRVVKRFAPARAPRAIHARLEEML